MIEVQVHNQRLESIISTSMEAAENYLKEGNFEACKLLTIHSMALYKSFDQQYKLGNNDLRFRLILGHIKLVSLERLIIDLRTLNSSSIYKGDPTGEGYDANVASEINHFTGDMFTFTDIKEYYGLRLKQPTDLDKQLSGSNISEELRNQFKEWFEYLHCIKVYIDTFNNGRPMTDQEKDTIDKVNSKFNIKEESKQLPSIIFRV